MSEKVSDKKIAMIREWAEQTPLVVTGAYIVMIIDELLAYRHPTPDDAETVRALEAVRRALESFANPGAWDVNRKLRTCPDDPIVLASQALAALPRLELRPQAADAETVRETLEYLAGEVEGQARLGDAMVVCARVEQALAALSRLELRPQADAETVRALEECTKQLEAMNCSASHAASWVEPKSDTTTKQIERNKSALSRLSAWNGEIWISVKDQLPENGPPITPSGKE